MQRRDFLKTTGIGVAGLASGQLAGGGLSAVFAAEGKSPTELTVRRAAPDRFELDFRPAAPRPLRILQITDTHFGNPEGEYPRRDERSFELIRQLVAQEKVDLVAHTGDFVNNDRGPKVLWNAVDFMDSLGVPWTHALGNHDIGAVPVDEFRAKSRSGLFGEFEQDGKKHYAFRFDVVSGGQPAYGIYVFDSGFKNPLKFVSAPQLEWFARQMQDDEQRQLTIPAIALIHIPVVEFEKLRAAGEFNGIYGETVCCETDSGKTFAEFEKSRRVQAIFSGHDHENDYRGAWNGIELVYGRVSGYSGYGDLDRGGRLIEIDVEQGTYRHRLVFPAG
ncbi:MAG: metallophosphoesterase [Planctomycetaceae bacterium]|nr:metallophosphoesterase [Planctomycetaceae bacterium]